MKQRQVRGKYGVRFGKVCQTTDLIHLSQILKNCFQDVLIRLSIHHALEVAMTSSKRSKDWKEMFHLLNLVSFHPY